MTVTTANLQFIGDPGASQIGPGSNPPVIDLTPAGSNGRLLLNASGIILEGFEVVRGGSFNSSTGAISGQGYKPVVRVGGGSTGVTVRHNTVRGGGRGIAVADCQASCAKSAVITDNIIKWNGTGIWIASTANSVVRNNDIFENKNGIEFGTLFNPHATGNLIDANHIHKNVDNGVILTGTNNTIQYNLIDSNGQFSPKSSAAAGIRIKSGSDNTIDHNTISTNGWYGIEFASSSHSGITISTNLITGNGTHNAGTSNPSGVFLASSGAVGAIGVTLTANDISNNPGDGVYVKNDSTNASATGNIITSTGSTGSGISVNHASTGAFTATNNDWGVYTSEEITALISISGGGSVPFTPFATSALTLSAGAGDTSGFP